MESMNLRDVINQDAVVVDVPAANKEEIFQFASERLYEAGILTSIEDFKRDLYYRESLGQTGIGGGVAIPHGKSEAVKKTCIAVFKTKQSMEWETADQKPVQVFVVFAVNAADKNNYFMKLMAQVARRLAKEGVCEDLLEAGSPQELVDILAPIA